MGFTTSYWQKERWSRRAADTLTSYGRCWNPSLGNWDVNWRVDAGCQRRALYYGRRSFTTCAVSSLLRQVSVGEGVPLSRPRIQVVHGTVPQKCARNALPAPSGILSRPALRELLCHPLPT